MTVAKAQLLDFSEPPPVPIRRFTVVEYHRLGEVGVLTEDDRVELLEGWILEKMVHNPPHGATIDQARDTIGSRLPPEWRVRVQLPITTAESEPEPDLAVVRGPASRYARSHPGPEDVAFLVEVADTTLVRDRGFKGRIYARARVPIYWIVNLVDRQIEVYTGPSGPAEEPGFSSRRDYSLGEAVPVVLEGREIGRIAVKDLLVA